MCGKTDLEVSVELFLKLRDPNVSDEENIEKTKKVLDALKPQPPAFTAAKASEKV